jgi:hypothetical protein
LLHSPNALEKRANQQQQERRDIPTLEEKRRCFQELRRGDARDMLVIFPDMFKPNPSRESQRSRLIPGRMITSAQSHMPM